MEGSLFLSSSYIFWNVAVYCSTVGVMCGGVGLLSFSSVSSPPPPPTPISPIFFSFFSFSLTHMGLCTQLAFSHCLLPLWRREAFFVCDADEENPTRQIVKNRSTLLVLIVKALFSKNVMHCTAWLVKN